MSELELTSLPDGWVRGRLKNSVASSRNGVWGAEPDGENDIRCVRVADFDRAVQRVHDESVTYRAITESERAGRVVEPGNLLLEKSGGGELSPVGFVVLYDKPEPAVCSNFVAKIVLKECMDPRFWTYVHGTNYAGRLTARSVKQSTGIQNLDETNYFNELALFPPATDQLLIANFLDRETAEIDAFIADQEELIGLLAERRAATIAHAVAKGLDPTVPMKDSGTAWFPAIPNHWSLIPVGLGTTLIQTGPFGSQLHSHEYVAGGVPLINPMHIVDARLKPSMAMSVTPEKAKELNRHALQPGDVIVARRGELGRCAVASSGEAGFLCGTGSAIIRLDRARFVPQYFQLVFSSEQVRHALLQYSIGSTMDNLNSDVVGSLRVPCPPFDEQHSIVTYLDHETAELDATLADAREAIALSKERRAALISAAVTGKIDVRGVSGAQL